MNRAEMYRQTADAIDLVEKHGRHNCLLECYIDDEWRVTENDLFNDGFHYRAKLSEIKKFDNTIIKIQSGKQEGLTLTNCTVLILGVGVASFNNCIFNNCKISKAAFNSLEFTNCDFNDVVTDCYVAVYSKGCRFKNYRNVGLKRNSVDNFVRHELKAEQIDGELEEYQL